MEIKEEDITEEMILAGISCQALDFSGDYSLMETARGVFMDMIKAAPESFFEDLKRAQGTSCIQTP